ncbi:ectoine/hydroxyectoine ABC transporter substrate-binding protein EhuB [Mesorhizobium sp. Root172]|jgi:polar amino acid transport system substrate-binding protein|uniref:ectoine/hydroxyectoine ABC transporter substrate-binding protein EhuB n=1 Tax=Mesorhizobium sp. Root172 TaxID=1736481 RepID=UPI0006F4D330|nr:ectoine/hydroxyectoine ABC transporter substrate-binding protein EhuB [Mesorhizobium sp. Root172]KRB29676.1 hypothetical protein ASE05_30885 [Mesorhizobium sp. Root172]
MNLVNRRSLLKGTAGASLLMLGPAPFAAKAAQTTFDKIKSTKVVQVAFGNEAPFAFKAADGTLTGSEPEILREITKAIGVEKLEGVLVDFASMIPSLVAGRVDLIGAGTWIRPERCKQIIYSNPTYTTGEAIWVAKGNPKNLRSFKDIAANKDVRCALLLGSAEIGYADIAGIAKEQQVVLPNYDTCIAALQAGRVDCAIQLTLSARSLYSRLNDANLELVTKLTEDPIDENGKPVRNYGATGFRKEDTELCEFYNTELAKLRASGRQLELMAPFGFLEEDLPPPDLTAEELCRA